MSNWMHAVVKLENIETKYFNEALERMGFVADFNNKKVNSAWRYHGDNTVDCVLNFKDSGKCAEIGIIFSEGEESGTVVMTALSDWDGKGYTDKSFVKVFTMNYTAAKTIDNAALMGFEVVEETTLARDKTRLTLRRAA